MAVGDSAQQYAATPVGAAHVCWGAGMLMVAQAVRFALNMQHSVGPDQRGLGESGVWGALYECLTT